MDKEKEKEKYIRITLIVIIKSYCSMMCTRVIILLLLAFREVLYDGRMKFPNVNIINSTRAESSNCFKSNIFVKTSLKIEILQNERHSLLAWVFIMGVFKYFNSKKQQLYRPICIFRKYLQIVSIINRNNLYVGYKHYFNCHLRLFFQISFI